MKTDSVLVQDKNHGESQPTQSGENGSASFAAMLEEYEPTALQQGQLVEGEILMIEENVIYADVGAKRTAIIPPQDLENVQPEIVAGLSVGDEVLLYVTQTPRGDEDLIVSLQRGLQQKDWQEAEKYLENQALLKLDVVGYNKGGLLVQFGHLRGFIPNSHVPDLYRIRDNRQRTAYKAKMVGSTLPLKVIEIDRERKRLVLSVKAARKELRRQRLEELEEGAIVTGKVINIVDFGAFVDLGEVDGLIHISNLAWHQVRHPSDEVSVGEEVQVRIDSVDVDRERISLNRKDCLPNPWQKFDQEHDPDELIEGVVTNVTDFGAFVLLPGGIEGLIHVGEMHVYGDGRPQDVLQTGDVVLTRLLSVDPIEERVRLSQRQVTAAEEMEWMTHRTQAGLEGDLDLDVAEFEEE